VFCADQNEIDRSK